MKTSEEKARAGRRWRGAVLIALCGLVYLLSFDQGRQAERLRLEEALRESAQEMEARDQEILRLKAELAEDRGRPAAGPDGPLDRVTLRVNQSRLLFNNRLVLTLLKVDSSENRAVVQLNFLKEEVLRAEELVAGGSFRFQFDGRAYALVLGSLSISTANLNLVELKDS